MRDAVRDRHAMVVPEAARLPEAALYRVRFKQSDVWPDYAGPGRDSVDVEIYEHWLDRA